MLKPFSTIKSHLSHCFAIICSILLLTSCLSRAVQSHDQSEAARIVQHDLAMSGPVVAEELKGGLSGARLFLVAGGGEQYVVRFLPQSSAYRESICLQIASDTGYGPHIYARDPRQGYVVMQYVPRHPISLEDRMSDRFYQALGEVVATMHRGPNFPENETVIEDTCHDMQKLKKYKNKTLKGPLMQMGKMLGIISKAVSPFVQKAPCHDDLNPNNMIWTGSTFTIIDYETATQDDPYFDLATVVMFNCLTPQQEEQLLLSYLGRPMEPKEKARLYLMKQTFFITYATRFFSMHPETEYNWNEIPESYRAFSRKIGTGAVSLDNPTTQFQFARSMFSEAVANFQSQEFKDALELLKR